MKQYTHIGVYALCKKDDSLILIKKARGPYIGKWDLPGGSFEFGEAPLETLHRELMEETGLIVKKSKLLDVLSCKVHHTKPDGNEEMIHHIGILYSIETNSDYTRLKSDGDGEDSLGAEWIEVVAINDASSSPFVNQCLKYI